ncbi:hypothetical protein Xoosp13_76 [Xanthomonas phage Xoo-sp13]|nr:hypothetical protein Xoosp13_76 [Xanthomonas phage Xoo-sp13]
MPKLTKNVWDSFLDTTYKLRWVYIIGVPVAFVVGLYLR